MLLFMPCSALFALLTWLDVGLDVFFLASRSTNTSYIEPIRDQAAKLMAAQCKEYLKELFS